MGRSWEIREHAAGDVTVVELSGRMTLGASGDAVEARLQELIQGGARRLVLDLSGVEALDSRGIKVLVRAYISVQKVGGELKLMRVPPRIHQVLQITRLLQVFEVYDDEAAAAGSFSQ
jgi:anti-sigma B factor antagonist